jgi:hypothetical protein
MENSLKWTWLDGQLIAYADQLQKLTAMKRRIKKITIASVIICKHYKADRERWIKWLRTCVYSSTDLADTCA